MVAESVTSLLCAFAPESVSCQDKAHSGQRSTLQQLPDLDVSALLTRTLLGAYLTHVSQSG